MLKNTPASAVSALWHSNLSRKSGHRKVFYATGVVLNVCVLPPPSDTLGGIRPSEGLNPGVTSDSSLTDFSDGVTLQGLSW